MTKSANSPLDKIDPLAQNYLNATRYKGGVVNSLVAIATAKALLKRYPRLEKENLKIERSWAQSLFRRMGFVRRIKTTGKVHIPVGAQKEAELKFLHQIVNQVEKYQILSSLIINFDQTQSKYVQVSSMTMAKRGETNLQISGANDKDPSLSFPSHSTISFSLCSLFTKAKLIKVCQKWTFRTVFH